MEFSQWKNCIEEESTIITEVTMDNVANLYFATVEDVSKFMAFYAKAKGFSLRICDSTTRYKAWCCVCEGTRDDKFLNKENRVRKHRRITKFQCNASFRALLMVETNTWKITQFCLDHSHPLTQSCETQFLRSHRVVTQVDDAQIRSLRFVGVKPCQILQLLSHQAGGIDKVNFLRTDLYNHLGKTRAEDTMLGDFTKSIGFLEGKKSSDPGLFYRYTINDKGRWEDIFWCDSGCRLDYASFGDVITFDSTHSTNRYGKPMVVFTGVNNHNETCIFGCALLEHETKVASTWLLKIFLEAHGEIIPQAVLTDGDRAINFVFKTSAHRLCTWHIARNAINHVHRNLFKDHFYACMKSEYKKDFEDKWKTLLVDYGIAKKALTIDLYKNKKKWSYAWHRNRFFVGQHTNSRSESINHVIKRFVTSENNLYELLQHFDIVLEQVREHERTSHFQTWHTGTVLVTNFHQIENQAAEIYTKAAHDIFVSELGQISSIVVEEESDLEGDSLFYNCSEYVDANTTYLVKFDVVSNMATCSCKKFHQEGFLCRHCLVVYHFRHCTTLPKTCFLCRWTRCAKDGFFVIHADVVQANDDLTIRQGALVGLTRELASCASKDPVDFNHMWDVVTKAIHWVANRDPSDQNNHSSSTTTTSDNLTHTTPSTAVATPRRNRLPRCSICHQEGHNRTTCEQRDRFISVSFICVGQ